MQFGGFGGVGRQGGCKYLWHPTVMSYDIKPNVDLLRTHTVLGTWPNKSAIPHPLIHFSLRHTNQWCLYVCRAAFTPVVGITTSITLGKGHMLDMRACVRHVFAYSRLVLHPPRN